MPVDARLPARIAELAESVQVRFGDLRVVLVQDWLLGMRGGERVFELLCATFVGAPVFTLYCDPSVTSPVIRRHKISLSLLQRVPGVHRFHRYLLPLLPAAIESLHLPECDLVLSNSHCVAKGVRPPRRSRHLCYCLTPMRYAWGFREEYLDTPLKRVLARPVLDSLRRWDRVSSRRVDRFVGISRCVQDRIRAAYGRESDLVCPPTDVDYWTPAGSPSADFDLVVAGLSPLKRVDLAVSAYRKLKRRLVVVGDGLRFDALRAMATPNVQFVGRRTDAEVRELYQNCSMLVFPGLDDFGLVPVEAQACGRPVVAFAGGGALETVRDGETGLFFAEPRAEALAEAVVRCAARRWDASFIRANACRFGHSQFFEGLLSSITALMATGADRPRCNQD